MRSKLILAIILLAGIVVCLSMAQAQTTVDVQSGEVVSVDGNHLVIKMSTGQTKVFEVPEGAKAVVNGKELSVHELTPGMILTRTITTTTEPVTVQTTVVKNGTVWKVLMPKTVIVTMENGKNKQFTVPEWMTFDVNGQKLGVADLKPGMKLTATMISENVGTMTTTSKAVTGSTPAPATTLAKAEAPAEPAPANKLPKTAGPFGELGLLGAGFLSLSYILRRLRK